ncbi:integral membrane protein 2C-like [Engraulis encrasicolus]|uniref:integral membrane protein 2C-like n=1 Tax=Engraulis encrasicolus TaxID=184585 RepID=UPI002FD343A5
MVKISFQPVAGPKAEKEETQQPPPQQQPAVLITHPHDPPPHLMKRSSVASLCCLTFALLVFTCSLLYACVYIYTHYIIPQHTCSLLYACVYIYTHYIIPQVPAQSEFRCRVVYEDDDAMMMSSAPLRTLPSRTRPHTLLHSHTRPRTHTHTLSLEEKVDIFLQQNYEVISVPAADLSSTHTHTHPAQIVHDFHQGLTAYHDLTLDKCYVSKLNTSVVMEPRNLWELLINIKRGSYLPQRYLMQEQMSVSGRIAELRPLGPYISNICSGKETYQLTPTHTHTRRVYKRGVANCFSMHHFENTFVMETLICDNQ